MRVRFSDTCLKLEGGGLVKSDSYYQELRCDCYLNRTHYFQFGKSRIKQPSSDGDPS